MQGAWVWSLITGTKIPHAASETLASQLSPWVPEPMHHNLRSLCPTRKASSIKFTRQLLMWSPAVWNWGNLPKTVIENQENHKEDGIGWKIKNKYVSEKKKRNVEFRFPHQTCLRSPRFYLNWSWQQHLVLESFRWSLPHSSVQPCGFFLWFPLIHPLLPIFQFLSQGPPISPSPWLACWWPARVSVRWIIPPHTHPHLNLLRLSHPSLTHPSAFA